MSTDLRERLFEYGGTGALEEVIRAAIQAERRSTWTVLPVKVTKDADGKTAMLQPTVKAQVRDTDGKIQNVDLPEIEGIVHFAGGGGLTHTVPIKKDDEGFVVFASRAIDAWFQNGGSQAPVDARSHHLSDGMFVPGMRSMPRELKGISPDSVQTRTDDKKSVHDVSQTAITAIREAAAHQVNGTAIMAQIAATTHIVDGTAIQQVAKKFLHNCGIG